MNYIIWRKLWVRQADHEYMVPEPDLAQFTVRLESLTYTRAVDFSRRTR
jgi:hypothetical protein